MKKFLLAAFLLLFAAVAHPAYNLSWSDEFDYPGCTASSPCTPDPTKWVARDGDQWQSDPIDVARYTSRLKNVRVQDGLLIIETHKDTYGGKQYTSGTIETYNKKHFQFGKLEIRAKGTSIVNSVDQAIWTLGASGPCGSSHTWPNYGEVDIVEYYPGFPYYSFTRVLENVHTADHETEENPILLDGRAWHTYFMEWDATVLKLGVDGVVKKTKTKTTGTCGDWPFQDPLFLLITTQIGTIGGGTINDANFPLQFEIDYVRYYQMDTSSPSNKIPSAPGQLQVQ